MSTAKIVVLAGQSNAVGVGHVAYLPEHYSPEVIGKFTEGYDDILINYFSHDIRSNGFVKTSVGCTEKAKKTLGPEVGIAETLSEKYPDERIYIVKSAVGGTNIYHDWLSPSGDGVYDEEAFAEGDESSPHFHGTGWCYNELVKILSESINILKAQGLKPEIRAFCWMQGESDADTPDHVAGYHGRYVNMLGDLNVAFGEYFKDCVYIDAGISEIWCLYRDINEIKKAHAESTANSFFIDTIGAGLTTTNEPRPEIDTAHYDSDSTVKLGNLFGERITL